LLKGFDYEGFVFYTNYSSAKAQELLAHPYAAITFLWHDLERQVRIEGAIEKVSAALSEEYFQSRPRKSQIGAWASPQSTVIADRSVLEAEMERLDQEYAGAEVLPRPLHWGGYLVRPDLIEFWQGRRSRLHDRVQYRLENGQWVKELLAP
jgi:pyridoxamine 5'-phosphate oxidase